MVRAINSPVNDVASAAASTEAMKSQAANQAHQPAPPRPGPAEDPDGQLEDAAHEQRHGREQPDLQVTEREVVPDQRHRRALGAVDQFVNQPHRERRR